KAFTVQRGVRRHRELDVEQDDFFDPDRAARAVDDARPAQRPIPVAHELDAVDRRAVGAGDEAARRLQRLTRYRLRERQRGEAEELTAPHRFASAPARTV